MQRVPAVPGPRRRGDGGGGARAAGAPHARGRSLRHPAAPRGNRRQDGAAPGVCAFACARPRAARAACARGRRRAAAGSSTANAARPLPAHDCSAAPLPAVRCTWGGGSDGRAAPAAGRCWRGTAGAGPPAPVQSILPSCLGLCEPSLSPAVSPAAAPQQERRWCPPFRVSKMGCMLASTHTAHRARQSCTLLLVMRKCVLGEVSLVQSTRERCAQGPFESLPRMLRGRDKYLESCHGLSSGQCAWSPVRWSLMTCGADRRKVTEDIRATKFQDRSCGGCQEETRQV